jgi:signal transduction histidine kinase
VNHPTDTGHRQDLLARLPRPKRSPTPALLFGLLITLVTVGVYSFSITRQISALRRLDADLGDRNRRATLQLLRIQNDLNQLAFAMRDILETRARPLATWAPQFEQLRADLDDALRREEQVAVTRRTPEQARTLSESIAVFWTTVDRVFELAGTGRDDLARAEIRQSLQARQSDLSVAVGRLLLENNESEAATAQRVQDIYADAQRLVYWFLSATLVAIAGTSLFLIYSNRRLFAQLTALSDERRELAQTLIATREATLREISRELHDEFGQLLTAIGSMLRRVATQSPDGSPLRADLREIGEVAQTALDNVRGLSQTLHPSILDELGLGPAVEWYLSTVERQHGIRVVYERSGGPASVPGDNAIHVYRVLQEAISNVARHSGANQAWVRLREADGTLELDIEDRGRGLDGDTSRRGLGRIAMRERAALLGGEITYHRPVDGGTIVRLRVPLKASARPLEP